MKLSIPACLSFVLLHPLACAAKNVVGYYGNWYVYQQAGQLLELGPAVAAGMTHLNYAFATIAYSNVHKSWYLDLTDAWADVQNPFGECTWNSGGIDLTSYTCGDPAIGNIAVAPYFGAPGACPANDCWNGGGDGSSARLCQTVLTQLPRPGFACGQLNWLLNIQKAKYPNVKFLLSVGGWFDSQYFTPATRPENVEAFVKSVTTLVTALGFDGIDYDWEYPAYEHGQNPVAPGGASPPGTPDDVTDCTTATCIENRLNDSRQFTDLIVKTRQAFESVGDNRFGEEYIISFAAPAGLVMINKFGPDLAKYITFMNLMTYDMHGSWETTTNHQAPIFDTTPTTTDPSTANSLDNALKFWVAAGIPADMINIGLPFYARVWDNVPPTNNGLFQPGTAPASSIISYSDIDATFPNLQKFYDEDAGATWGYEPTQKVFLTFDDPVSIRKKKEWGASKGVGGWMIWELHIDGGLLMAAVGDQSIPTTTVTTSSTTTTTITTSTTDAITTTTTTSTIPTVTTTVTVPTSTTTSTTTTTVSITTTTSASTSTGTNSPTTQPTTTTITLTTTVPTVDPVPVTTATTSTTSKTTTTRTTRTTNPSPAPSKYPYKPYGQHQSYTRPRSPKNGKCGKLAGGISCEPSLCCSSLGFCGATTRHCNASRGLCQRAFGKCWNA